jgi:hypothetical protein
MRLTEHQVQKVVDWLNTKWQGAKACPVCQSNAWNISDIVFEAREFYPATLVVGEDAAAPMIFVTCTVCGHTLTFSALKIGVVQPSTVGARTSD